RADLRQYARQGDRGDLRTSFPPCRRGGDHRPPTAARARPRGAGARLRRPRPGGGNRPRLPFRPGRGAAARRGGGRHLRDRFLVSGGRSAGTWSASGLSMPALRHPLSRLRSGLWYAPLYGLATVGYGLVSMGCSRFDPSGRRQHRVAQAWARMLLRVAGTRVVVIGEENLLAGRPSVMVCNHLSYMDVPVLFARLPLQFRILARQGLFRIPFLGGHLQRCQHLPVDQSNVRASMRSLKQAAESVAAGLPLFVFPEAGRSFSGTMQE